MEESVAEGRNRQRSGSGPPLSRSLGVVHTSFIGVGTAIGATIFVITGNAIASAGPAIILSYLFGALSAITDGTSYSELASSMPNAGGGYHFVRRALGGVPSCARAFSSVCQLFA